MAKRTGSRSTSSHRVKTHTRRTSSGSRTVVRGHRSRNPRKK